MAKTRKLSRPLLAVTLCAGLALTGCKKDGAGEGSGASACDDYVAAMEKCLEKIPKQQRGPMKKQLEAQRDAFENAAPAAKKQMSPGCRTGLVTLEADPRCK